MSIIQDAGKHLNLGQLTNKRDLKLSTTIMTYTKYILAMLFCCISLSSHAEYHRSLKAKAMFRYLHPCPATGRTKGSCPGYIIDHVDPLACGGADEPSNMQWQTKAEAMSKDKWERKNCK